MKIVYGATRSYYSHLFPTVTSLLDHNDPEVIYILAEDDHIDDLPDICKVINVSDQKWIKKDSPNWNTPYSFIVLIRVAFAYLFPDDDKILSLDVDTIICDSLKPIWNIDIKGKYFAAVNEYKSGWKPFGNKYYNCGVCLFNLDQIRSDKIMNDWIKELNTEKYLYPEQDVMNMYSLPDKIAELPVRYNESYCCGFTDDPAIVHYACIPNWMNDKQMFRREYLDTYLRTPDSRSGTL